MNLVIRNAEVVIDGAHTFSSLTVENGGKITHTAGYVGGMNVTVTGDMNLKFGGLITATGRGYGPGEGPGRGANNASEGGGSGASYGGEGTGGRSGTSPVAGPLYDDVKEPVEPGSGGGTGYSGKNNGSAGGGAIRLTVNGTLQVDGNIEANGHRADLGGAGSGGSIYLNVGTLAGNGLIQALGGPAYNNGGGGGGGRIAVYYVTKTYTGTLSAAGAYSDLGTTGAGTVFLCNCTIDEALVVSAKPVEAVKGSIAEVAIEINDQNRGVSSVSFDLSVKARTPKDAPPLQYEGSFVPGDLLKDADANIVEKEKGTLSVRIVGTRRSNGAGTLLTVPFLVPSTAATDTVYSVEIRNLFLTINDKDITSATVNGLITVKGRGPGDVDGDGKVTLLDATTALQIVVNLREGTPEEREGLDVNKDERASISDVTKILRIAVGLEEQPE